MILARTAEPVVFSYYDKQRIPTIYLGGLMIYLSATTLLNLL